MKFQINWNVLGVSAATACAIHCALMPLFISSLPFFGINLLHNIFFETGMILLAIIIGGISLRHGYLRHHHRMLPLISFISGMGLLIVNQFLTQPALSIIIPATAMIILAYYLNWKFCRQAKHCHATDCNH